MNAQEVTFWYGLASIIGMLVLIGLAGLVGSLVGTALEKQRLEDELRQVKFERDSLRYIVKGIPPRPKPSPTEEV